MPLAAAQVLDAVAARLSGNTAAGTRVYTSRLWPLSDAELPAWRVLAADEEIDAITVHYPALLDHRLSVECVATVKATANVDDAMHDIAASALSALYGSQANTALGLSIQVNHPTRIARRVVSEGQAAHGELTLELLVRYRTAANAPSTIL